MKPILTEMTDSKAYQKYHSYSFKKTTYGASEVLQWLKRLAAKPVDLCSLDITS